jgi:hypothetical protein
MNDNREIAQVEERLRTCSKRLHVLAPQVGAAKQIRQYDTDRRKNALSKYVVKSLKAGESATAAEAIGRADLGYQAELEALSVQYEGAERTIAEWDAEQASFEAARSLLSMAKESMKVLEG